MRNSKKCLKALEYEFPRTKGAWYKRKEAYEAITLLKLHEASHEIYFKGNEAWALREYQPDVLLGSREEILTAFIKNMKWLRRLEKSAQIPDGDFTIKFHTPILFDKKLAERFSGNEHPENQIDGGGRIISNNKKLRGET